MPKMKIEQAAEIIEQARTTGRPFVVKFIKQDGTKRTMTCLTADPLGGKSVKGVQPAEQRKEEDLENQVRTVFSLDVFQELVKEGKQSTVAGKQSWRRIPLNRVLRAKLL